MNIARLESMVSVKDVSDAPSRFVRADFTSAMSLTGFNLEVAQAALSAGFNTWNHNALYKLIWAVKRVALRHCHGPLDEPPPKDPYYPERYRPSGLGDNTNKKRSAPPSEAPTTSAVKLEVKRPVLKTTSRTFKYKNIKRKLNPAATLHQANAGFDGEGTRPNPVNPLSDDDENTWGARAKKQKLSSGNVNDSQLDLKHTQAEATRDSNARSTINHGTSANLRRVSGGGVFTRQADFVSLLDADPKGQVMMADIAPLSPRPSPRVAPIHGYAAQTAAPPNETQLKIVRRKLENAVKSMVSSRDIMRIFFTMNEAKLKSNETMSVLEDLSRCLICAEQEARDGAGHVDEVIKIVSGK